MATRIDGLRVALAGAGWVSEHHLRGWARAPAATVVAICDPAAPPVAVDELRVEGSEGSITFDGVSLVLASGKGETAIFDPAVVYADSYASAIAHFASGVLTGVPFETSVDDNLRTLELVEDAYRLAGSV